MNEGTWYRTGTVSLTNGSDLVNGYGTQFIDNVLLGAIFFSPTGLHEVTRVVSDTQLQLVTAYAGPTVAGATFAVAPTQGAVVAASKLLQTFLESLGALKQAWDAGELNGKGLAIKGILGAESDLPLTGNAIGDGYLVGSTLYVWGGSVPAWHNVGSMVSTPELEALRTAAFDAKTDAEAARDEVMAALAQVRTQEMMVRSGTGYWDSVFAAPAAEDTPAVTVVTANPLASGVLYREKRTGAAGSTDPVDMDGDTHFLYDGAPALVPTPSGSASYVRAELLPGGTAQGAYYLMCVETVTDQANAELVVKVRPLSTSVGFRLVIDGKWLTIPRSLYPDFVSGSDAYIRLVFPTAKKRVVRVEFIGNPIGFGGMIVPAGQGLSRPNKVIKRRVAILGDSYTGGSGAPPDGASRLEVAAHFIQRLLGADSFFNFGIGGTGWVETTTPFPTRIDALLACKPHVVVLDGSRNDGAKTGVYEACLATLLRLSDIPEVYVTGPATGVAPSANAQVRAACIAAGRPFFDGVAGAWVTNADIGPDGVHLTFAGHQKRAAGLYGAIRGSFPMTGILNVASTAVGTPTSTALVASPATVTFGNAVTLTATVTPASAGVMRFEQSGALLGTVTVAAGSAAFTTSALPVGSNVVTARFVPSDADVAASSASISYAVAPAPPFLPFADTFNRTDSTSTLGSPWTVSAGVFGITGNAAYVVSGASHNYTYVNCERTNVDITVVIGAGASNGYNMGVLLRYQDSANEIHVNFGSTDSSAALVVISGRVAGSTTTLANVSARPLAGDTMRVTDNGSDIVVYRNGVEILRHTTATFSGNTRFGLWALGVVARTWNSVSFAAL